MVQSQAMSKSLPAPTPPSQTGTHDGLAWAMWMPKNELIGGVLILHGAGSQKENHFPIARDYAAAGIAAVCFDQRGHGASTGPMDARIISDAVGIAGLLPDGPVALRGSSMGGWVALAAAAPLGASALMAICPTTSGQLLEGVRSGRLPFNCDESALATVLDRGDPPAPSMATLLMHAAGDEVVPVARSRELAPLLAHPQSRFLEVPGGHHRSLQHDPEMVSLGVRFTAKQLKAAQSGSAGASTSPPSREFT